MRFSCPYGWLLLGSLLCSNLANAATVKPSLQEIVRQHYKHQYSNPDSAWYFLKLMQQETYSDKNKLIEAYNLATWHFSNKQVNLDSAIVYSTLATDMIAEVNDKEAIARAMTRKGFVHSKRSEYKLAIHWLEKSLAFKSENEIVDDLNFSYNLLGNVYRKLDLYDEALDYYDQALEVSQNAKSTALTHKNMGMLYLRAKDPTKATQLLAEALELYKANYKNKKPIMICKKHLADAYFQNGQFEDAIRLLRECEKFFQEKEKKENLLKIHRLLAMIYLELGELELAEKYGLKTLARAEETGIAKSKLAPYKILIAIYDRKKEFALALNYQKKYQLLKDSTSYAEIREELIKENLIEQINSHEQEITILKQEKTINRLLILSITFAGLFFAFLIQRLYKKKVKRLTNEIREEQNDKESIHRELEIQKEHSQQLESELQAHIQLLSAESRQAVKSEEILLAIERLYQYRLQTEEDWSDFKLLFTKVHPSFLDQLKQNTAKLSHTDVKVVSLMRLNLENSEIGKMLAISPESIRKAKYRLRQKLRLANNQELQSFVFSL